MVINPIAGVYIPIVRIPSFSHPQYRDFWPYKQLYICTWVTWGSEYIHFCAPLCSLRPGLAIRSVQCSKAEQYEPNLKQTLVLASLIFPPSFSSERLGTFSILFWLFFGGVPFGTMFSPVLHQVFHANSSRLLPIFGAIFGHQKTVFFWGFNQLLVKGSCLCTIVALSYRRPEQKRKKTRLAPWPELIRFPSEKSDRNKMV